MLAENIRVDDFREVFHPRAKRRKRTRRRYCSSQPVSSLRFIFVFSLLRFGGKRRIGRESRRKPAALPFQKQCPFHRSTRTDDRRHYRSLSLALFRARSVSRCGEARAYYVLFYEAFPQGKCFIFTRKNSAHTHKRTLAKLIPCRPRRYSHRPSSLHTLCPLRERLLLPLSS